MESPKPKPKPKPKTRLVRVSLAEGGSVVSRCCCLGGNGGGLADGDDADCRNSSSPAKLEPPAISLVVGSPAENCPPNQAAAAAADSSENQRDPEVGRPATGSRRDGAQSSLEEVRRNLSRLLDFHRLQTIYLGALLYAVIHLLYLAHCLYLSTSLPLGGGLLLLVPLMLLLAAALARHTLHFQRLGPEELAASTAAPPPFFPCRPLALGASLLLLYLPALACLLLLADSSGSWLREPGWAWLAGPHLGLLYLLPSLLGPSGAPKLVRFGLLLAATAAAAAFLVAATDSKTNQAAAGSGLLAAGLLLAGVRRWRRHRRAGPEVLEGARALVEAKVSLEHQRQQQETLLLSVLPAYVAEQVKRNMLKKTTSETTSGGNELANEADLPVGVADAVSTAAAEARKPSAAPPSPNLAATPHHLNHALLAAGDRGHQQSAGGGRRGFQELHIRTYNNVSLLYGDIVGFTQLCSQLSAWHLVRVLNDLFSHFDRLAERHRIMRIKILGDCYYGVAGIPEFAVLGAKSHRHSCSRHADEGHHGHAHACVDMGLDMIQHIGQLNVERQQASEGEVAPFELNMRIGIHSGHIHSGVIGHKKWQFDVWSNDVSIAMHCESSGVAGRVQVTQATVQHLKGAFSLERAPGGERDPFLASKEIQTYLIRGRSSKVTGEPGASLVAHTDQPNRSPAPHLSAPDSSGPAPGDEAHIRQATLSTIREALLAGDACNSSPANAYALALQHRDLRPLWLNFRDLALERLYAQQPVARHHLLAELAFILCLYITTSSCLVLGVGADWGTATAAAAALLPPLPLLLAGGASLLLHRRRRRKRRRKKRDPSRKVTVPPRLLRLRPLLAGLLLAGPLLLHAHLLVCGGGGPLQSHLSAALLLAAIDSSLQLARHRTRCLLLLALLLVHLGLATPPAALARLLASHAPLCSSSRFAAGAGSQNTQEAASEEETTPAVAYSSLAFLLILILWSLAQARQLEYAQRANFLWRNRLNVDHEELEYISGINKVLLENILPSHVVQYYLEQPQPAGNIGPRPGEPPAAATHTKEEEHSPMRMSFSNIRSLSNMNNELYHEQHDSVAVMFASIPHFYEFYDESDINKRGLGCIVLLNEIICDFDMILLKNKFSRIEKIKTIGSTYMAAAGLRPNNLTGARNSTASQASVAAQAALAAQAAASATSGPPPRPARLLLDACGSIELPAGLDERRQVMSQQKLNLVCIIQFATSLMSVLNRINKQSFQVFKLRVGVNAGPVVAGVIGAQRPFYDIWGDCVNIASRMESLGEVGRIQVEEQTAKLLMESLCQESYSIVKRGHIEVKGKGGMVTYFVDKRAGPSDNHQQP